VVNSLIYDSERTNEGGSRLNWHKADIPTVAPMSPFGGKADMPTHLAYLKRITPAY
jgi:hypothetical protein